MGRGDGKEVWRIGSRSGFGGRAGNGTGQGQRNRGLETEREQAHVFRLDVAVHDANGVQVGDCGHDLCEAVRRFQLRVALLPEKC